MSARDFGAHLRLLEPLEHRRHAAGLHPLRQEVLQRVGACGIGIGVAVDVEAARLRIRDHLERGPGLAPVVGARALEVHDLHMHAAGFGHVDRLLHRVEHVIGLVAQVGEVGGVVRLQHAAERVHLGGPGVGARRGEQPGGQPERTRAQALFEQIDHLPELGRGGLAVAHAHGHQAQRVVADQHAGVHRGVGERVEILRKRQLAERRPRRRRAEIILQQFDLAGQAGRDREAAMADDLGGHPLAHLAFGLGIDRQREVRMGLDVDEARRHGEPRCVDGLAGGLFDAPADRGDTAVADGDVARRAGRSAAVINQPAADQDVVHA